MKKNITLLMIVLILIQSCLYAQNQVAKYYLYINKAELAICKENYKAASHYYKKAFRVNDIPFRKDLYTSFKINHKYTNDTTAALADFQKLALCGQTPKGCIDDTLQDAYYLNRMRKIADTTQTKIIKELHDKIMEIAISDRKVRENYDMMDTSQMDQITVTDKINLDKIKKLYKEYPCINEYTAGFTNYYVVFLHACRAFLFDPKEILYNEVLKGNYNAHDYIRLEDFCKTEILDKVLGKEEKILYGTGPSTIKAINNTLFIYPPQNMREVNYNRHKIGFSETWQDFLTKMLYMYQHPDCEFKIYPVVTVYSGDDDNEVLRLKKEIDEKKVKGYYLEISNP